MRYRYVGRMLFSTSSFLLLQLFLYLGPWLLIQHLKLKELGPFNIIIIIY
jgi:hypothetical protein